MWFNETLASGMVPYHHIIGGENGMGEDRRWLEPAHQYFDWMAQARRALRQQALDREPRRGDGPADAPVLQAAARIADAASTWTGMYYALLEGRFLFDFVHEDKLAPEDLAKYSALLLPNTALLSDEQCRQLRAYVEGGGSLLATFETSLYNERNERRGRFRAGATSSASARPARSRARRATPTWRASRSSTRS